ncbi:MAG: glycosyltransferase family 2 protein [Planctomycetota bacterium]
MDKNNQRASRGEPTTDELWDVLRDHLSSRSPQPQDRGHTELLLRLLGTEPCRRLGVYHLPAGFQLSVIIPVFNEAETLERAIDRVQQTGLPLQLVLVDDGSTDGTRDVLSRYEGKPDCKVVYHAKNQGKGAALKSGLAAAEGDVTVIQDADMEYDPGDFRLLLQPIVEGRADVVYGSRFSHTDRAVSPWWHQAANQLITFCTKLASGYNFSDVETCYKLFRTELVRDVVPTLRENRFGIEIELTFKLLKQPGVRFYERPIRYARRSYAEGKKIGWRDGISALRCIVKYSLFN